ncbi:MAG: hypothetical protein ABF629_12585 [Sporolactobacillus sp.]
MNKLDLLLRQMPKPNIPEERKQNMYQSIINHWEMNEEKAQRHTWHSTLSALMSGFAILALVYMIAITAYNIRAENSNKTDNIPHTSSSKQKSQEEQGKDVQHVPIDPIYNTTLMLPNGKMVTGTNSEKWNGLSLQLIATDIPSGISGTDMRAYMISNHSSIISHETVPTSAGKADLILSKRGQPAAAHSSAATYEYWVIVHGQDHAYAIMAAFIDSQKDAKNALLTLLQNWHVPKEGLK